MYWSAKGGLKITVPRNSQKRSRDVLTESYIVPLAINSLPLRSNSTNVWHTYLLNHFKSFNITFLSLKELSNYILPFLFYWGLSLRFLQHFKRGNSIWYHLSAQNTKRRWQDYIVHVCETKPTTVLFRTTLTQTVTLYELLFSIFQKESWPSKLSIFQPQLAAYRLEQS